ncbi:hypothetical protein E5676_scaffold595G00540 [Cucumis melo var. makuwa]|uniref:Uncharacterized protein n=1 Tax=Cucumis melo var. makuwa TaxID=1194695 RepID=A0A5A7VIC3_CUCMM|nr:hypothetical protein E6C27_scaffold550G00860 [Cucumis melo var. makuwa]TYK30231.1 hypothetical protein E5676_scaffold595G00540 [Cucumis melo var. makuwa]
MPTTSRVSPQSQKSKPTKSKSPPPIEKLTTTSSPKDKTNKNCVLILFYLAGTSLPCQEETPQPLDAIPINQAKPPSPETSNQDVFHETFYVPTTLLDDATKESEEGGKGKEVLEEAIDDPLQREKEVFPSEKSLHSKPKSIPEALT